MVLILVKHATVEKMDMARRPAHKMPPSCDNGTNVIVNEGWRCPNTFVDQHRCNNFIEQ
jgi:hypothetical protein